MFLHSFAISLDRYLFVDHFNEQKWTNKYVFQDSLLDGHIYEVFNYLNSKIIIKCILLIFNDVYKFKKNLEHNFNANFNQYFYLRSEIHDILKYFFLFSVYFYDRGNLNKNILVCHF